MAKKPDDQYSKEEAALRMVAALQGARIAGHMPMKPPRIRKAAKKTKPKKKPGNNQKLPKGRRDARSTD